MKLHKIIYAGVLSLFLGLPFAAQEPTDPQGRFKSKEIGVITTLAGGGRVPFSITKNAAETIIEGASGIATDQNGNLYVAGFLAHRVFKIDKGGSVSVFAGTGEAATSGDGGRATEASINGPSAVATDGDVVYIAEQLGDRIRRVDAQGIITTYGGGGRPGTAVSEGARAEGAALQQPAGLFVRKSELYFTEFAGNYVRRIDRQGRLFRVAGTGARSSTGDGASALKATLQGPAGITGDARGRIYVSEVFSARVRAINEKGKISTFSGLGKPGRSYEGVNAKNANLRMPHGLAMDGKGNLYIGDFAGNRVYIVNSRNIIRTFAGTGQGELPRSGTRTSVSVESPLGLTVDSSGNLLVATYNQGSVLRVNPQGAIAHVAGEFPQMPTSLDSGRDAFFKNVGGVTADRKGNIYLTEVYGNKVWSMNTGGGLRLLTGSGIARSQGDKRAAQTADVNHPVGVVAAENGLFVIEADGHRVRFVDNSGVIVTAVGTGVPGFSGDGNIGALAGCAHPHYGDIFGQYSYPADSIAKLLQNPSRDFSGNLLNHGLAPTSPQDKRPFFVFVDTDNNRVRKIDERGIITTVAGNGKSVTSGDRGPAIRAGLNRPEDVVVDSEGNLYISEAHRVRKVDTRGIITTYAGTGRRGFAGNGGPAIRADLDSPYGLALDGRDLYIADSWNNVVWKVDEKGIITLFAGNRQKSSRGDGSSALNASLNAPIDLAVQNTAQGTYLLVAELEGARLRAIRIR